MISTPQLCFKMSQYADALRSDQNAKETLKELRKLEAPLELFKEYEIEELAKKHASTPGHQGHVLQLLVKLRKAEKETVASDEVLAEERALSSPAPVATKKSCAASVPTPTKEQLLKAQISLICLNLSRSIQLKESFLDLDALEAPYYMLFSARKHCTRLLARGVSHEIRMMAQEVIRKVEGRKTTSSRFIRNPESYLKRMALKMLKNPDDSDEVRKEYCDEMMRRERAKKRWDGKTRM